MRDPPQNGTDAPLSIVEYRTRGRSTITMLRMKLSPNHPKLMHIGAVSNPRWVVKQRTQSPCSDMPVPHPVLGQQQPAIPPCQRSLPHAPRHGHATNIGSNDHKFGRTHFRPSRCASDAASWSQGRSHGRSRSIPNLQALQSERRCLIPTHDNAPSRVASQRETKHRDGLRPSPPP